MSVLRRMFLLELGKSQGLGGCPYCRLEHTSENDKGRKDENSPPKSTVGLFRTTVCTPSMLPEAVG